LGNRKGNHTRQVSKDVMKLYGAEFKRLRESVGMTTREMAEALGVFRTTIVRWERGQTVPQRDLYLIKEDILRIVNERKIKNASKQTNV